MTAAFQLTAFYGGAFESTIPLVAATGAITLTGNTAGGAITLPAEAFAFPLTKNPAAIKAARLLATAPRVMSLTGGAATSKISLHPAVGAYGVTLSMSARAARTVLAGAGNYPQVRVDAGLQKAMVESGRVPWRGFGATAAVEMPTASGAYTIGGFANARSIGRPTLSSGARTYTGQDIHLPIEAPVGAGAFGVETFAVGVFATRIGYAGPIQVIQQKYSPDLFWQKILTLETARYTVATKDGYLGRQYSIDFFGAYPLAGANVELRDRRTLNEQSGTYILVDRTALLVRGGIYDFSAAPTVMSVPKEDWVMRCA